MLIIYLKFNNCLEIAHITTALLEILSASTKLYIQNFIFLEVAQMSYRITTNYQYMLFHLHKNFHTHRPMSIFNICRVQTG